MVLSPEQKIEQILSDLSKKQGEIHEYLKTPIERKKEEIANIANSNLSIVLETKNNLENIRKEPLNLAFLLKDLEIGKCLKEDLPVFENIPLKSMEIGFY